MDANFLKIFLIFLLIGFIILGSIHAYRVVNKIAKDAEKTGQRDYSEVTALDITCVVFFFWAIFLVTRTKRLVKKVRGV